jgi:hypothetical protein
VSYKCSGVEVEEVAESMDCPCPHVEVTEEKTDKDESYIPCPYQAKHLSDTRFLRQCDTCRALVFKYVHFLVRNAK